MSDETFERKVTTPAEREARKAFRQVEAAKAMTDHEKAQKTFNDNRERLKAERLARSVRIDLEGDRNQREDEDDNEGFDGPP
jgi:hypothetical protein